MRQGIQRAMVAGWLMVLGASHAYAGGICHYSPQPGEADLTLLMIDHEAAYGPPEIAQAATALHAGRTADAVALLTTASNIPFEDALQHGKPYLEAVMNAGFHAWTLEGCP